MQINSNSNRLFAVPFIAILVLGLLFMTAVLPMVKMDPKDIPVGLVIADEGEMGGKLSEALLANAPELVKFTQYESVDALTAAMDDREVYGALVLPTDFSAKVATLQSATPEKAIAQVYINEGANASAAAVIQSALTAMVSGINMQLSTQLLTTVQQQTDDMKEQLAPVLQAQGENSPLAQVGEMISPIQPSKVQDFANPVQAEIVTINPANGLGNSPMAFMTVTWFSSIIGAVILFLVGNKREFVTKEAKLKFNTLQAIMPFIYGLFAGYVATWYATWLLGFEFESFNKVALFIALGVTAFTYMIFATLRWLKLPSIIIFVLIMLIGMSAVQVAPEMMPAFYRDFIIPWIPLRFLAEGLKEVLFFSHDVINSYSIFIIWILVVAFIVVCIKNVTEKVESK